MVNPSATLVCIEIAEVQSPAALKAFVRELCESSTRETLVSAIVALTDRLTPFVNSSPIEAAVNLDPIEAAAKALAIASEELNAAAASLEAFDNETPEGLRRAAKRAREAASITRSAADATEDSYLE